MYPALAIQQAVADRVDETLWVGGKGGMEADLVARARVAYTEISAAGLHGVGLTALPGNLLKLVRGYFQSKRILRGFQPDVVLFTGGYLAVPMAVAASKVSKLLYVPDIEPGMALKYLSRYADTIALTDEKSKAFFNRSKQMVVTGYPIRNELVRVPRDQALRQFNFSTQLPVLLVIGGSKGARSLNQAIFANLESLLQKTQILHLTGQLDWDEARMKKVSLESGLETRYHPQPYLHEELSAAFSCASFVLCRAGASTLGELPFYGLPAILVPYPYAWRYQKVNADHLAAAGGALIIENSELCARLDSLVSELLADSRRLANMGEKMKKLVSPNAASKIANLLVQLAEGQRKERSGLHD